MLDTRAFAFSPQPFEGATGSTPVFSFTSSCGVNLLKPSPHPLFLGLCPSLVQLLRPIPPYGLPLTVPCLLLGGLTMITTFSQDNKPFFFSSSALACSPHFLFSLESPGSLLPSHHHPLKLLAADVITEPRIPL